MYYLGAKALWIIYGFLIIVLYRAGMYERRRAYLVEMKRFYFDQYIEDQKKLALPDIQKDENLCKKYGKSYDKLLGEVTTIKKYILDTGIFDPHIFVDEPVGMSGIRSYKASVLDNFYQHDNNIIDIFNKTIGEAIGYYAHRRNESFNPFFWIEYLLFLPRHIAGYVGITSEAIKNIAQAIYFIAIAIMVLYKIFTF